ncbi:MAG TPA: hypothetical protein VGM10_05230 [Actinocrinis sp.]|jgi:hypothetical protein
MTKSPPGRHHRHLIELASLLTTAGLADMFADAFGARTHGAGILIGLGAALVAGTIAHHLWLGRAGHAPPAAHAAPEPVVGAIWRLRTEIDNTPGRLAVLAGALAAVGANIHALQVHPTGAGVIDEILVETPATTSAEHLCAALRAVGGRAAHAAPTDVLALADAPAHALGLAARLALRPEALPEVLADLLGAERVDQCAEDAGPARASRTGRLEPADRIDGTTLHLRGPAGRHLVARRPGVPFTATELARARAMADLVEACQAPADRIDAARIDAARRAAWVGFG